MFRHRTEIDSTHSRRGMAVAIAVCLITVMWAATATATPVLLGTDRAANELVRIDPATAAATRIGPLGLTVSPDGALPIPTGLTFGPGGILYGTEAIDDQLFTVDPATGAATLIGTMDLGLLFSSPAGLTFAPDGTLYTVDSGLDRLHTVDPTTGKATAGPFFGDFLEVRGLVFGPGGTLYGVSTISSDNQLLTIDPSTGDVTTVGSTGFDSITGLTFGPGGVLLGINSTTSQLLTIDTATGAASVVGSLGLDGLDIQSLAFGEPAIDVPVPGTLAIFAVGLLGLGLVVRRRRAETV